MKKRIYHFNLIEIVLTVAVIAFGVVVILGMIPRGLIVSKETATISFSSEIMDQMAGFLLANKTSTGIPNSLPGLPPDNYNYQALLDGGTAAVMPGVYKYADGVFVIVNGSKETVNGENVYNIEFAGVLRVYKDTNKMKVIKVKHDSAHDSNDDYDCFDSDGLVCGFENDAFEVKETNIKGSTVYMVLSYPLSLPEADRTKSYFSFDVPQD